MVRLIERVNHMSRRVSRRGKILSLVALVLVGIFATAYANRTQILITALAFAQKRAYPIIGAYQPIEWQTGAWGKNGKRPPNIIVILTDDMGFNDVSYNGGGLIETPHIDRLVREGVRFTHGYAGSAVCSPSRAMLMTGRYSTRFGFEFTPAPDAFGPILQALTKDDPMPRKFHFIEAEDSEIPFESRGLPPQEITLAEELQQAGYRTLHIGKWHLGRDTKLRPSAQGFDESLMMEGGLYLPVNAPDVVNARNEFAILDKVQWEIMTYAASFNDAARFEPKGYLTDYFTEEAVRAIEANKARPFFLYLAHWGPHTPLQASKADYEAVGDKFPTHRARVYAAMLRALDRSVGRVMQALKDNGIDDNTLVVFTSDNGGANYIGMPDINKPYRGWKLSFFEGGTHVPFAMRWPGVLPRGADFSHNVSHLDIMPTALAAAGRKPSHSVIDGVNLLPYLTKRAQGNPHDALFFREGHYQAVIAKGWKLQRNASSKPSRLYHLAKDPYEKNDLSATRHDKLAALNALLDRHNAEQAAPLWPSRTEIPIWIDKSLADAPSLQDDYIMWPN